MRHFSAALAALCLFVLTACGTPENAPMASSSAPAPAASSAAVSPAEPDIAVPDKSEADALQSLLDGMALPEKVG